MMECFGCAYMGIIAYRRPYVVLSEVPLDAPGAIPWPGHSLRMLRGDICIRDTQGGRTGPKG